MIYLSAGTESSTIGDSIGPPPVTSHDIISIKWLSIDSRGEGLETHAWDSVQFRPIRVSPTPTQCCSGN